MKNVLCKYSGDVTESKELFDFVVAKAKSNYAVLICGGGSDINDDLKRAGFIIEFDSLGRRVTKTWEERMIMRNVLEHRERRLQDKFVGKGVVVLSPILYAGQVLCPINGDDMVKAYELGFDEVYVFTRKERIEKKQIIFRDFDKVKIIGV